MLTHITSHHLYTYIQAQLRGVALLATDIEDQLDSYDSKDEAEPYDEDFDSSEDFEMEPSEEEFYVKHGGYKAFNSGKAYIPKGVPMGPIKTPGRIRTRDIPQAARGPYYDGQPFNNGQPFNYGQPYNGGRPITVTPRYGAAGYVPYGGENFRLGPRP